MVSKSNLGEWPGLTAAASLMIDYVLTVAVSVAAGIAAITSAIPSLFPHRTVLGVLAIVLVLIVNLRGVRESGKVFAVPTYMFIGSILVDAGRRSMSTPLRHVDSARTSDRGRRNGRRVDFAVLAATGFFLGMHGLDRCGSHFERRHGISPP